jgi:SAM-dependent methyltransferase
VLSELLAQQIPSGATVLDIGCGDGTIGSMLTQSRPDITVQGIEVSVRPGCRIPCRSFDGEKLPYPDCSFDVCLFVDVLHHTNDVEVLLQEGVRVSRSLLLLKDHVSESSIAHGVPLPNNYQSRLAWDDHFSAAHLNPKTWQDRVPIYPFPLSGIFGRTLHFVALLEKSV